MAVLCASRGTAGNAGNLEVICRERTEKRNHIEMQKKRSRNEQRSTQKNPGENETENL